MVLSNKNVQPNVFVCQVSDLGFVDVNVPQSVETGPQTCALRRSDDSVFRVIGQTFECVIVCCEASKNMVSKYFAIPLEEWPKFIAPEKIGEGLTA